MIASVRPWFGWWAAGFVFYLLLVWNIAPAELAAGTIVAAFAATLAELARRNGLAHFDFDVHWLPRARVLPALVVKDTGLLAITLWQQVRGTRVGAGEWRVIEWRTGGKDARSALRRALVNLAVTVTPNDFVVGIDAEEDYLLLYRLREDGERSLRKTLGRR